MLKPALLNKKPPLPYNRNKAESEIGTLIRGAPTWKEAEALIRAHFYPVPTVMVREPSETKFKVYVHPSVGHPYDFICERAVARKKVCLAGTVENEYRGSLTATLLEEGVQPEQIINPVVKNWDEEAQEREAQMKQDQKVIMLYWLGPNKKGRFESTYSPFEATMGLYDRPGRTVVVFDYDRLPPEEAKHLRKAQKDLKERHRSGVIFESTDPALVDWLVRQLR